ncbi:MAG: membrane protein insertion efficiency factor YidD [Pseudomonadota bacterium]
MKIVQKWIGRFFYWIVIYPAYLLYQSLFSAGQGRRCRFEPTCSVYAREALKRFHFFYALKLIIIRLCKCQPFYKRHETYLFDPVPEKK